MIRFIDLRGQIELDSDLPKEEQYWYFSFWETVQSRYLRYNEETMWSSWSEFLHDYRISCDHGGGWPNLERLNRIVPKELKEG